MMRSATVFFALFAALGTAFGQPEPPPDDSIFLGRYDSFRQLFAHQRLSLATKAQFRESMENGDPSEWIVVALGDLTELPHPQGGWKSFLDRGGRLLAATGDRYDWFADGPGQGVGVRFMGGPLTVIDRAQRALGGMTAANFFPPAGAEAIFQKPRSIDRIVLQDSGYLYGEAGGALRIAGLLRGEYMIGDRLFRNSAFPVFGSVEGAFPAAAGVGLFVASPKVFSNGLMLDAELAPLNAPFAINVLAALTTGRDPLKTKVLFLEDGVAVEEWIDPRYARGDWVTVTWSDRARMIDKLIRSSNRLIRSIQNDPDERTGLPRLDHLLYVGQTGSPDNFFLRWGVLAALGLLALMLLRWLWSSRMRPETPAARPGMNRGGSAEQSARQEVVECGHYVEIARRLASLWARQRGVDLVGPPPAFSGSWLERRRLRKQWELLGDLAADRPAPAMSWRDFQRFQADLSRFSRMVTNPARTSGAAQGSPPVGPA
jgi:hypothetical protein